MNDEEKGNEPDHARDYRPHWKGSHHQHIRTLIIVAIAIAAFVGYIVYHYGVRIHAVPPPL